MTRRFLVPVFAHSAIAAVFALSSVLLLLPVLKEIGVCQGVQRYVFMRLVLACGLELAVALLRIRLVNVLGLRRACKKESLCVVICTRETVGEGFLLSRTMRCTRCAWFDCC